MMSKCVPLVSPNAEEDFSPRNRKHSLTETFPWKFFEGVVGVFGSVGTSVYSVEAAIGFECQRIHSPVVSSLSSLRKVV